MRMDEQEPQIGRQIDRESVGALYEKYHDPIYRYCRHRLFTREAAEDVTSNVFMAMVDHIETFYGAPQAELKRWLYAVATKKSAEYTRNTKRRKQLLAAAVASGLLGKSTNVSNNGHPSWPSIFQAIQKLKAHEQAVVTLRFLEGMGMDDIATILGRNSSSVRVILSRAVQKIREKLADVHTDIRPEMKVLHE